MRNLYLGGYVVESCLWGWIFKGNSLQCGTLISVPYDEECGIFQLHKKGVKYKPNLILPLSVEWMKDSSKRKLQLKNIHLKQIGNFALRA